MNFGNLNNLIEGVVDFVGDLLKRVELPRINILSIEQVLNLDVIEKLKLGAATGYAEKLNLDTEKQAGLLVCLQNIIELTQPYEGSLISLDISNRKRLWEAADQLTKLYEDYGMVRTHNDDNFGREILAHEPELKEWAVGFIMPVGRSFSLCMQLKEQVNSDGNFINSSTMDSINTNREFLYGNAQTLYDIMSELKPNHPSFQSK